MADELKQYLIYNPSPVTYSDFKDHAKLDANPVYDAELIHLYINAATRYCEDYTGMQLTKAERVYYFDGLPTELRVPRPPLVSVESVEHYQGGEWVALPASDYEVNTPEQKVVFHRTGEGRYRVNYTAGYEMADNGFARSPCPESLRQAILMLSATWYAYRESVTIAPVRNVPFAVEALLNQWRVSLC